MDKYGISSNVIDRFCRVYNWFLERRKGGKREMMHIVYSRCKENWQEKLNSLRI